MNFLSDYFTPKTKFILLEEILMSRYTGPSWKISRRLGISLSGTGKELARRPYAPGQHGPNSRGKQSEYGMQLTEKQKLRHMYGMNERQFRNLFVKASKIKEAVEATVGRPAFVSFDAEKLEGSLTRLPERDELYPEIDEALVVEYYNQSL